MFQARVLQPGNFYVGALGNAKKDEKTLEFDARSSSPAVGHVFWFLVFEIQSDSAQAVSVSRGAIGGLADLSHLVFRFVLVRVLNWRWSIRGSLATPAGEVSLWDECWVVAGRDLPLRTL